MERANSVGRLDAPEIVQATVAIRDAELGFPTIGGDIVIGQMVADLGLTRSMLATTVPREWERVAAVLLALLDRYPFKDGPRYAGERILLGALANELRAYAVAAGEPVSSIDLRAPDVREQEARATRHAA